MKKPFISVVMPVYNAENYLKESIKSILSQTFEDFELIIINDASTDRSLDIVKEYAKKDKRIKVLINKKNKGIAETRNMGIKSAKGKYIATQDADDISFKNRFKEQVEYMEKNSSCGVVGAWIEVFGECKERIRKYPKNDKKLRKMIFFFSPIAQPVSMIRKKVFDDIGYYNKKYPPAEDLDLWFRIGSKYNFGNIQKVLLKYRYFKESATLKKTRLIERLSSEIRWNNRKNRAYKFGFLERIYFLFHYASIYIIPPRIKVWMFNKIR